MLVKLFIYSNTFEQQKVNLVVYIFNEMTVSALRKHGFADTAYFVHVILIWWSFVNIKRSLTYVVTNNTLKKPFESIDDVRLAFLTNFLAWLKEWKEISDKNHSMYCLTLDTYNALHHCTYVLREIIVYALNNLNVKYVSPAKFQTDNLESRFGQYR